MEQFLKEHFSRKELDDKFKSYSAASKQNEELSDESRKTYNKYLDSILLYSAGSFSFTVALIGLVIGDKAKALAHIGFFLPNIYWLYVSWILFALTCFLILVSKRFRSKYIGHFGMANYVAKYKDYEEAQLKTVREQNGNAYFEKSQEEFEKTKRHNIALLTEVMNNQNKKRDFSYNIMRICHSIAEISTMAGLIFLLLFSIQLGQAIVWQ
jgi:hypothetical protein